MYKIGYTSALQNINTDDGKAPVKIIGEVLNKMIKKANDCPKAALAPNKIMKIADGCFSSASVISVKDEKSSGSSSSSDAADADSADAEAAAADAASTSGSCGGGRSSSKTKEQNKSVDKAKSNKCCGGGKSCCGGGSSSSKGAASGSGATSNLRSTNATAATINGVTGEALVDMYMPSTTSDMVLSDCATVLENGINTANEFKRRFCNFQPYPECATCPYALGNVGTMGNDLTTIFTQIQEATRVLLTGDYEMAEHMFECPGQLALLMNGNIEDVAKVAAANAVYAVITLAASRGAIAIYSNLATEAIPTDFRIAVMHEVGALLQSGSMIGMPGGFARELSNLLVAVGCTANTLTRMKATSGSSRSSRFGAGYNLWGNKGPGTKNCATRAKSAKNAPKISRVTGKAIDFGQPLADFTNNTGLENNVLGAGEVLDTDDSIIPTVYKSGGRPTPSAASIAKADVVKSKLKDLVNPSTSNKKTITKTTKYATTSDTTAQSGKTYYRAVVDKNGNVSYKKLDIPVGTQMDQVVAQFGQIFSKKTSDSSTAEPTRITSYTSKTSAGRKYSYYDSNTGDYVEIDTPTSETLETLRRKVAIKLGIKKDDVILAFTDKKSKDTQYTATSDSKPVEGIQYYTINDDGEFVELIITDHKFPEDVVVYEKVDTISGSFDGCTECSNDDSNLLDDGTSIELPVSIDIDENIMTVDTRTLVTRTQVLASDMAKIEGLDMSLYEVKMAYLLDSERNGSIMPVDVEAEVVSTILDTVSNND